VGGGGAHFCIKTEVKRHCINFKGFILKFIKTNVGKKILTLFLQNMFRSTVI